MTTEEYNKRMNAIDKSLNSILNDRCIVRDTLPFVSMPTYKEIEDSLNLIATNLHVLKSKMLYAQAYCKFLQTNKLSEFNGVDETYKFRFNKEMDGEQ